MKEIWKDIEGYEGKYIISSFGRVVSLPKPKNGNKKLVLSQSRDSDGYLMVSLPVSGIKARKKSVKVHSLVAYHFIGKPTGMVCHIDGNKTNNRFDNLYYGNHASNILDRYRQGRTKISISDVLRIKEMSKTMLQKDIAKIFNIRQNYVSRIINNKRCRFINEQVEIF